MASGRSSSENCIMCRVFSLPRVSASEEMNSMVTRPTPPMRFRMSRKYWSVIPAMGARMRGGSIATRPMCILDSILARKAVRLGPPSRSGQRLVGARLVDHHAGLGAGAAPSAQVLTALHARAVILLLEARVHVRGEIVAAGGRI